jgi:hypothetical protein
MNDINMMKAVNNTRTVNVWGFVQVKLYTTNESSMAGLSNTTLSLKDKHKCFPAMTLNED